MKRSSCCVTGLFAAIVSWPAVGDPLPPANSVAPKVGDVIEYDERFLTVACKRWEVTAVDKDGSSTAECDGNIAYVGGGDAGLQKIVSKSGATLVEFKPRSFGLSFPLEVGKTWQGKYTGFSAAVGISWDGDASCEVKPVESVTVPAGQFDAYRIDCVTAWTAMGLDGRAHTSTWYAPKVGAVVKTVDAESPQWDSQVTSITLKSRASP